MLRTASDVIPNAPAVPPTATSANLSSAAIAPVEASVDPVDDRRVHRDHSDDHEHFQVVEIGQAMSELSAHLVLRGALRNGLRRVSRDDNRVPALRVFVCR